MDNFTSMEIRGQYGRAGSGLRIQDDSGEGAIRRALGEDVSDVQYAIISVGDHPVTFVDADTHDWAAAPTDEELTAFVTQLRHQPDCWWITHGKGLRLVYTDDNHDDRALAAALELPKAFGIEIKKNSRHPRSAHPGRPGAWCGPVTWNPKPDRSPVVWGAAGRLDDEELADLLRRHNYEPGARYDHDRCPIAGHEPSDARDCVVVLDSVIHCHRCEGRGIAVGDLHPGVFPIALLSDGSGDRTLLARLARSRVHWEHARHELSAAHPNIAPRTLESLYQRALVGEYGPGSIVERLVFNPSLRVVYSTSGWLDSETFRPFKMQNDTANVLPACSRLSMGGNGELAATVDTALRDRVKQDFRPDGYTPLRIVEGLSFHDEKGTVTVAAQPPHQPAVRLLKDHEMMDRGALDALLQADFPGLQTDALLGSIAGAICGEVTGVPQMLLLTGPTGSGKGATATLAACILGGRRRDLRLTAVADDFRRQVGTALASGAHVLFIDEISRTPKLGTEMRKLLELSSSVAFRPLFKSDTFVRWNGALLMACLAVPEAFASSPEIARRVWTYRLARTVADWSRTVGPGGIDAWRGSAGSNALAANTLLTMAYNLAANHSFQFAAVAAELGFSRPDENAETDDGEAVRDLYRHARDEDGQRRMNENPKWTSPTWIDANSPRAASILDRIEANDGSMSKDQRFFHLKQNLVARDWNRELRIDKPDIVFDIDMHGLGMVLRFRQAGTLRGHGKYNEELPPIGGADTGPGGAGGTGPGPQDPPDMPPDDGPGAADRTRYDKRPVVTPHSPKSLPDKDLGDPPGPIGQIGQKTRKSQEKVGDNTGQEVLQEEGAENCRICPNADRPGPKTPHNKALGHNARYDNRDVRRCPNGAATPVDRWPEPCLVIDFETYFAPGFSLGKMSIPEYVHDPRFRVHGLALRHPDGAGEFRTDVEEALADLCRLYGPRWERVRTVAFNAPFDGYVLRHRFDISPAFWVDPLSMAHQVLPQRSSYSLASLCGDLGLGAKGEELGLLEGILEPDPRQMAELRRYALNDVELTARLLDYLLPRFSRPDVELRLVDQCVRMATERGFRVDADEAGKLHRRIDEELDALCREAGLSPEEIASDTAFSAALEAALAHTGRTVPTKPDKNGKPILAFSKTDEAYDRLAADDDPRVRALARARQAAQSAPAFRKRAERFQGIAAATDGTLPVTLKYCGAHTGRYSGAGGINLQNLGKRVKGHAAGLPGLLAAADGRVLVGADAAQIEARILAGLAGEDVLLEAFRTGRDVYCEFASEAFHEEVRKPREGDDPETVSRLKALRHIGKRAILGLGYGMGPETFEVTLRNDDELKPLFESMQLNRERIKALVYDDYRKRYRGVTVLWEKLEYAFRQAVKSGRGRCDTLLFERVDGQVDITLPSGRRLHYPGATISRERELVYAGHVKLWGGKIAENITQAIARDYVCEAMLQAEEKGYPVLLNVHDEIVLHVECAKVEEAKAFLLSALRTPPSWMDKLPCDAECWDRKRLLDTAGDATPAGGRRTGVGSTGALRAEVETPDLPDLSK